MPARYDNKESLLLHLACMQFLCEANVQTLSVRTQAILGCRIFGVQGFDQHGSGCACSTVVVLQTLCLDIPTHTHLGDISSHSRPSREWLDMSPRFVFAAVSEAVQ